MNKKRFTYLLLLACASVCIGFAIFGSVAIAQSPGPRSGGVPPSIDELRLARQSYSVGVVKKLHKRKFYPRKADDAGITGTVDFSFIIGPKGRVEHHTIERSSGHSVLDNAVGTILNRVRAGPPPGGTYRARTSLLFLPFEKPIKNERGPAGRPD